MDYCSHGSFCRKSEKLPLESNCMSASGKNEVSHIALHPSATIRSQDVLSTCGTWQWCMKKPGPCTPIFTAPEVWKKKNSCARAKSQNALFLHEMSWRTRQEDVKSCKQPMVEGQRLSSCWDMWPRSLSGATIPGMKTSGPEHESNTQHILFSLMEEKRYRSKPAQCLPFRTQRSMCIKQRTKTGSAEIPSPSRSSQVPHNNVTLF